MDLYPEECDQIEKYSGLDYGTVIVLLVQKTLAKHYDIHQLPDIHFICNQAHILILKILKSKIIQQSFHSLKEQHKQDHYKSKIVYLILFDQHCFH